MATKKRPQRGTAKAVAKDLPDETYLEFKATCIRQGYDMREAYVVFMEMVIDGKVKLPPK